MKYLVSFLYPLILIITSIYVYHFPQIKKIVNKNYKILVIFILINFVFGNLFLYLHLQQEQYIYFWDFSGFWRKTVEFNRILDHNVLDTLKLVYESMLYQEYSYFPEWFLSLPIMIIGQTFPRYVISMFNFFVLPANLILVILLFWIQEQLNIRNKWISITALAFLVLFTGNILPMKLGYIGSAGLPFIGFIILTLLTTNFEEKQIKKSLFIGLNLVILVLIRRWYSYVAVSFFITYPLTYLFERIVSKTLIRAKVTNFLINVFLMGITALLILLIGFYPLLVTFLSYDYQLAYQSAKVGGYLYAIEWFKTFYSPLLTIIFIYGFIRGVLDKKMREIVLLFGVYIIVVIFLFYRIQVFGSHHYYIINMYVSFIVMLGIVYLLNFNQKSLKPVISIFLIIAMSANFGLLFIKRENSIINQFLNVFQPISTALHYPPRYREDVDTIRDIATYLDYTPSVGEYVYVLAGSANINDDVLRNAWFPEKLNSVSNIEPTMQLDTRDGLPKLFFKYSYIVVADPIQYHNGEEYQKVIGILADGILHDDELRQYYCLEKDFTIIDGIKVYVYKLIEDVPYMLIDKYKLKFKSIYPDYPFLYEFEY